VRQHLADVVQEAPRFALAMSIFSSAAMDAGDPAHFLHVLEQVLP
jgi:hypothetical protein